MQYRGLEFEEQEFNDCLNILHKEVVSFLNKIIWLWIFSVSS
jgi:hypothetical protein